MSFPAGTKPSNAVSPVLTVVAADGMTPNGSLIDDAERTVASAAGPVLVKAPRINDKRV